MLLSHSHLFKKAAQNSTTAAIRDSILAMFLWEHEHAYISWTKIKLYFFKFYKLDTVTASRNNTCDFKRIAVERIFLSSKWW